jgi:hypothetical protein
MANKQSIKQLYALAMAEGEGVGTAYEYYAKRLVLLPWLTSGDIPGSLLIAGLPEKYGASLDLILLGHELGCHITVVDDRRSALDRLSVALQKLEDDVYGRSARPDLLQTNNLAQLKEIEGRFNLAVSSEVVQRLSPLDRQTYVGRLLGLSSQVALFVPNAGNDAHVGLSGLDGVRPDELKELLQGAMNSETQPDRLRVGYLDMPPFPPGLTRTDDQREEAATGSFEAAAMWGLAYYARAERLVPTTLKRRWAHIVYAFLDKSPR